ncbi:hypothetical protein NQ315_017412 [Exocentrus adspersus]|uniref:Uncharacterized protein n=1 Tax=Exocentrus adspersus TaxID=1586481 RepID=A0AAV8VKE9_9CUCU|nr:hypothetical protein NQ315_017412 [Exocentrus adspersus]
MKINEQLGILEEPVPEPNTSSTDRCAFCPKRKNRKTKVLRTEPVNVPLDNVAEGYLILLVKLGVEEELSENTFKDIEKFVIHLYSTNDNVNSINSLRGILAASIPINKLPPTLDSLRQHCLRAHYQAKIWLNSNIPQQEIMLPSYERSGWKIEEGKLVAVLLTQPAFPEDTSVLSTCNCKKGTSKYTKGNKEVFV